MKTLFDLMDLPRPETIGRFAVAPAKLDARWLPERSVVSRFVVAVAPGVQPRKRLSREERRAYQQAWAARRRAEDLEGVRRRHAEDVAAWRQRNPEKTAAQGRANAAAWRHRNREKYLAAGRARGKRIYAAKMAALGRKVKNYGRRRTV